MYIYRCSVYIYIYIYVYMYVCMYVCGLTCTGYADLLEHLEPFRDDFVIEEAWTPDGVVQTGSAPALSIHILPVLLDDRHDVHVIMPFRHLFSLAIFIKYLFCLSVPHNFSCLQHHATEAIQRDAVKVLYLLLIQLLCVCVYMVILLEE